MKIGHKDKLITFLNYQHTATSCADGSSKASITDNKTIFQQTEPVDIIRNDHIANPGSMWNMKHLEIFATSPKRVLDCLTPEDKRGADSKDWWGGGPRVGEKVFRVIF